MMVPFSCEETEYQSTDQSLMENTQHLSAEQVRELSVGTLCSHLDLKLEGHRYREEDLWNVVVAAAAEAQSIESAAASLEGAPHGSTVRHYLNGRLWGRSRWRRSRTTATACWWPGSPQASAAGATRWPSI
jgi:hypothetical protein